MIKQFFPLLIVTIFSIGQAFAQQTARMTSGGIGYLEYLPQGYNTNSNKYPVVISLHGIKEKGNTITDVNRVANVGLPKYVKYGAQYPFILISPQLKTTMGRWSGSYVMQVINYVKTKLRIDPSRIYLTGLSLGGGGVWSVATEYPSVFAAILPICSGYNITSKASVIANADLPTWGFHGDADNVVGEGVTINMINAINSFKPSPLAKLTIFPGMGHVIWDKVYKNMPSLTWLLSFKKGTTSSSSTITNTAPVAKAGADKTLTLPANSVKLYGSATDSDGTISSYVWRKKSGPTATLSGQNSKTLSLTNLVQGTYVFTLTAKDNDGATDSDDITVIVKSSSTSNTLPVANAGANKTITLPTNNLKIYGNATDADGTISSTTWTKRSGGSATMSGANTKTLSLSNLVEGTYVFRLTVKDNDGGVKSDDMAVYVKRSSTTNTTTTNTTSPIANAGPDKTVILPSRSATIYGSSSNDGSVSSYSWRKKSGASVTMSGTNSKSLYLSNLLEGTYVFTLAVRYNDGALKTDHVTVYVKRGTSTASTESTSDTDTDTNTSTSNVAPVAYAGRDKVVMLPTNATTVSGSGNDTDGSVTAYRWSKISGGSATMNNVTSASLKLSSLASGTYVFRLAVRDNDGATHNDDVKVIVNHPPVASAGADRNLTLPVNAITLSGSASDKDGNIQSYLWSKYSGPNLKLTNNSSRTPTLSGFNAGTYVIKLQVKDNHGTSGYDYVKIVVKDGTLSYMQMESPMETNS
ncbi:MAG TPA: PHB depolymerase family esterase [Chryseosolibacter sp.]|nr:PHB depolymerase family esterase [Chryseosolibacter sp.]